MTPEFTSCSEPMIEVSGVRSSWLSVEVNSFFIFSISIAWVMSRTCTTTDRSSPCSLTSGISVNSQITSMPSRRTHGVCGSVIGLAPATKDCHTASSSDALSGALSIWIALRPMSSVLG